MEQDERNAGFIVGMPYRATTQPNVRTDNAIDEAENLSKIAAELERRGFAVSDDLLEGGIEEYRSRAGRGNYEDIADYIEDNFLREDDGFNEALPDNLAQIDREEALQLFDEGEIIYLHDEDGETEVIAETREELKPLTVSSLCTSIRASRRKCYLSRSPNSPLPPHGSSPKMSISKASSSTLRSPRPKAQLPHYRRRTWLRRRKGEVSDERGGDPHLAKYRIGTSPCHSRGTGDTFKVCRLGRRRGRF